MVSTCWALKQTDSHSNRIYVRNVKARDFDAAGDFALEGRPWIDQTGDLKTVSQPGMAVAPKVEEFNKRTARIEEARVMREAGSGLKDIAEHFAIGLRTVERWSGDGLLVTATTAIQPPCPKTTAT